ncbi:MAG: hypothetical protein RL006_946 [Chloroflexota bacterium]|jgi:hypothetical protein
MVDGECRNRLALPVYGARPSRGICAQCEHRNGLRGLGDAVAWLLSFTPAARLQKAGCVRCKERQEALNTAAPFPEKRKCVRCEKSSRPVDKPADV